MPSCSRHRGDGATPPVLHMVKEKHDEHDIKNMFWVIKNGIKLTGMPTWGETHTNKEMQPCRVK